MPKIPELQELLENAERMCDAVDDMAGRRHTTAGLLRVDLCLFLAHLCKADFLLADEEAVFQHFVYALISADGTRPLSEIAAYSDYINALRKYSEA